MLRSVRVRLPITQIKCIKESVYEFDLTELRNVTNATCEAGVWVFSALDSGKK